MRNPVVIVAEDDQAIRDVIGAAVSTELGAHVLLAPDGQRLLDLAAQMRPALIVTDVRMPRVDGPAFCALLRAEPGMGGVPVVAMSAGMPPEAVRGDALAAGCADFLAKPFELDDLLDLVRARLPQPNAAGAPSRRTQA